MKPKYIYNVTEQTVDVRQFTIETDKPFNPVDEHGKILYAIWKVDITKEGDTVTDTTDEVTYRVTYEGTDYGDDSQVDWDMSTL